MASEEEGQRKLRLEDVLDRVNREIGETITVMGQEVCKIPDFISSFFHSTSGWSDIHVEGHQKLQALGYHDLVERAKPLFGQALDLWLEKGYRYGPSLLTAREHEKIHSSGYERFMVLPDTVVSIANQTLKLSEEKDEPMSVGEIQRGRILAGMPAIDDSGTVTGEIVPISDSYHFLSEQRKGEVKVCEQQIVSTLRTIVNEAVGMKVAELTRYKSIVRAAKR
ncbi:hypothetical protein HYU17_04645 [Candidatus Woesearchaeota archaeon]|nr:hypothetical protein [Candidatus Woesearchaeota archaeon]